MMAITTSSSISVKALCKHEMATHDKLPIKRMVKEQRGLGQASHFGVSGDFRQQLLANFVEPAGDAGAFFGGGVRLVFEPFGEGAVIELLHRGPGRGPHPAVRVLQGAEKHRQA